MIDDSAKWIDSIVTEVLKRLSALSVEMKKPKMLLIQSSTPERFVWNEEKETADLMLKALIESFKDNDCQVDIFSDTDFESSAVSLDGYRGFILEPQSFQSLRALSELKATTLAQEVAIEGLRRGLKVISASPVLLEPSNSAHFKWTVAELKQRLNQIGLSLWQPSVKTSEQYILGKLITEGHLKEITSDIVRVDADALLTYSAKAYAVERGIQIKRGR